MPRPAALSALVLLAALTPAFAEDQKWTTIHGKVVYVGDPPAPEKVDVKDQKGCLKDGDVFSDKLVVDKATKGVRWVMVYLVAADGKVQTPIPIHPDLLKAPDAQPVIDQPCCTFIPHVLGIREGQTVLVKNSAPFAHNLNVTSFGDGPNWNETMAPGTSKEIKGTVPALSPTTAACNIHGWMGARIYTFKHPYFCVTEQDGSFKIDKVPVGTYFLVVDHEQGGFLGGLKREKGVIVGKPVEIKAGDNEFNFELKPKKE
jgi:hypothetical protein